MEESQPEAKSSARDSAYYDLKKRLMTLELAPGSVIDVPDLAKELSIGRTPIVEAMQRLALEGFLTIHPRRGTVVTEPSFVQAQHVFEARDVLEGRSARLAANRARNTDITTLWEIEEQRKGLNDSGHFVQPLMLDYRFHLVVAQTSGNPFLLRALDQLLSLNARLWAGFFSLRGAESNYKFPHTAMIDAIERHDADEAERLAVAHVIDAKDLLLTMFR